MLPLLILLEENEGFLDDDLQIPNQYVLLEDLLTMLTTRFLSFQKIVKQKEWILYLKQNQDSRLSTIQSHVNVQKYLECLRIVLLS